MTLGVSHQFSEHCHLPLQSEISGLESVVVSDPLKTVGSANPLCGCWRGGGGKCRTGPTVIIAMLVLFVVVVVFLSYRISFEQWF